MRYEYGFPEFEPGSPFYVQMQNIRETIRKMADEVSQNSGFREQYQDFDDFWKFYEELMGE